MVEITDPESLRRLIEYNPETGEMFWKPRTPDMFVDGVSIIRRGRTPEHSCANWNSKNAGRAALACREKRFGYLVGTIRQVRNSPLKAHRVAWAIVYGAWPEGVIDHINGDPSDNRIANLRDVTHAVNMRNSAPRSDNKSGYAGVRWCRRSQRWIATLNIGQFKTKAEAVAARDAAREGLGYTGRSDSCG